jgi:hypothetical protein
VQLAQDQITDRTKPIPDIALHIGQSYEHCG